MVVRANLISADTRKKILLQTFSRGSKEFLGKNERLLEKGLDNVIEIDSCTVKHIRMRMKTGRAAGPGDIPIELIKSGSQKLLEMITILLNKIYKWRESTRRVEGYYYNIDT